MKPEKEPCPNCKETVDECACLRNKCHLCKEPVGNITFTVCDKCWDLKYPPQEKPEKEEVELVAIDFAKWLKHLDNGTEHYNPLTKETSQSIGFSPYDCFIDDLMTIEELYKKYISNPP